jgi:hypothetical protein
VEGHWRAFQRPSVPHALHQPGLIAQHQQQQHQGAAPAHPLQQVAVQPAQHRQQLQGARGVLQLQPQLLPQQQLLLSLRQRRHGMTLQSVQA